MEMRFSKEEMYFLSGLIDDAMDYNDEDIWLLNLQDKVMMLDRLHKDYVKRDWSR